MTRPRTASGRPLTKRQLQGSALFQLWLSQALAAAQWKRKCLDRERRLRAVQRELDSIGIASLNRMGSFAARRIEAAELALELRRPLP